ncbi:hypothetical protein [Shewanella livingstonensis]|uniref:DUF4345 domain-containing protein n=1 Tax=Shewanella livingstonensis TaxID=150120 RepID=A0A3G8LUL6_9GAMM|nr:hypothetical protein [Shewanella livingstonensis]AZG72602.1 hypothetical protein EGC82_07335 [Shewanella livingstonensis]
MTHFLHKTRQLALFLAGFGTSLGGLYTLFPQWAVENLNQLAYHSSDSIFIQHWGLMVLMVGCSFFIAMVRSTWVKPLFCIALIEKLFFISLVLSNANQPFIDGFWLSMTMDSIICIYIIGYLWFCRTSADISS